MFKQLFKVAAWLDSLFWETRIVVTKTTSSKKTDDNVINMYNQNNGFRTVTKTIDATTTVEDYHLDDTKDGIIYIPGRSPIHIPDIVKNRDPLIVEGSINRMYRAAHLNTPIVVCINTLDRKMAFLDGEPLSRTDCIKNITKKRAFVMTATCRESVEKFNLIPSNGGYGKLNIAFFTTKEWVYFDIVDDKGNHIKLRQDNVNQFSTIDSCVKMAYVFARAIILDGSGAGIDISFVDEDDFARKLLSIILQRVQVITIGCDVAA